MHTFSISHPDPSQFATFYRYFITRRGLVQGRSFWTLENTFLNVGLSRQPENPSQLIWVG
jgi:hypothetical protein